MKFKLNNPTKIRIYAEICEPNLIQNLFDLNPNLDPNRKDSNYT